MSGETPPGTTGQLRIFINYRREDTADATDRLYDGLAAHFGDDHVFMDIDAIDPGLDFRKVITEAVDSCDVCLAVIGRRWLTAADADGRRRLDRPDDFVRMELQAALERDIRVVPVLVQGVEDMPGADDLPDGLEDLAWRNAVKVRRESWSYDLGRLIHALDRMGQKAAPSTQPDPAASADSARSSDPAGGPAQDAVAGRADVPVPAVAQDEEPTGRQAATAPAGPVAAAEDDAAGRTPWSLPHLSRRSLAAAAVAGLVVVIVVIALVSGGGGGSGPQDVVAGDLGALASADYATLCHDMTAGAASTAIQSSSQPTCPRALQHAFGDGVGRTIRNLAGQAAVGPVQYAPRAHSLATVEISAPYHGKSVSFFLPLTERNGVWKINETTSDAFDRDVGAFTALQS